MNFEVCFMLFCRVADAPEQNVLECVILLYKLKSITNFRVDLWSFCRVEGYSERRELSSYSDNRANCCSWQLDPKKARGPRVCFVKIYIKMVHNNEGHRSYVGELQVLHVSVWWKVNAICFFVCGILTNAAFIHGITLLLALLLFRHKRIEQTEQTEIWTKLHESHFTVHL